MSNANWSNPTLTSTYANFVSEVKNRDEDLALQFDGTTSTNLPTNTIRWDSSAGRWKKWNGSSWAELTSTYALTGLSTTGAASIGTTLTVTSTVTSAAGSATAAGLQVGTGTTYKPGIYSPGIDQLAISTSGTGRLFIDSSGRLLVGTSSSRQPAGFIGGGNFQLEGTTYQGASASLINNQANSDSGYLVFGKSRGAAVGSITIVNSEDCIGGVWFQGADGTNLVLGAQINAQVDGTPGTGSMPGRLVFSTTASGSASPTERMRLDSSGRLGLGSSNPQYLLDASGSAGIGIRYKGTSLYASIVADNSSTTGGGFFNAYQNGSQKAIFGVSGAIEGNTTSDCGLYAETGGGIRFYTNGSPTAKAVLTSGGSLGIGTASPGSALHVVGNIQVGSTSNIIYSSNFSNYSQASDLSLTAGSANLLFKTGAANTERVRVDSSGNVGIGCTPSYLLDVAGYIRSSAASQPQLILNSTASGSWKSNVRFQNSGTAKYEIGVDTASAGANNFYFYDAVAAANRLIVDAAGLLKFDSGFGSAGAAYGCRAWVNFNGTTASPSTMRGNGNVSSVTKNATGDYTINFSTAMPDANYAVSATMSSVDAPVFSKSIYVSESTVPTANAVKIQTRAGTSNSAAVDVAFGNVSIFR